MLVTIVSSIQGINCKILPKIKAEEYY